MVAADGPDNGDETEANPRSGPTAVTAATDGAATVILNQKGDVVYADAAALTLLDFRMDELLGAPLHRLLPELETSSSTTAWLRACCQRPEKREITVVTRHGHKSLHTFHCAVFAVGAEQGYFLTLRAAFQPRDDKQQLIASEAFLKRIVESAGDAIISVNADNAITLFNPAAERVFGYRAEDILGKPLDILLPPRSRGRHAQMMSAFAQRGESTRIMGQRGEITGIRRGGNEFPAEASISHFRIGDVPVYTVVLRDVTDLRRAERERRKSARLFQAIFNQTFQFLGILRPDGMVMELNDALLRFRGNTREEAIGKPFADFGWQDQPNAARAEIIAGLARAAKGEFVRLEVSLFGADGGDRTIDFSLKPIFDDTDIVTLLIFEGYDITERVHAENALRLSESRLSNAQRIGMMGNWEWDIATGDLYWSEEVFSIFGYERKTFGATYEIFLGSVHPEDRAMVEREVRRALNEKLPYSIDHRILLPSGEVRMVHEQGEVHYDDADNAIRMTGIVQDVTEQKKIENRLQAAKLEAEAASQAKSNFLANMSHELRTPLNAVIGFAEVMTRELYGPVKPHKYRSYIDEIFESGQHLLGLINTILDMSKIEAGRMQLSEQEIDLGAVLEASARSFHRQVQEAELILVTNFEAGMPHVLADNMVIRQILLNLLSNAVKFTPPGGSIFLSARREVEGNIIITVRDTGVGMAKADIPRAFEIFGQLDNSLTRKYEGTGLGLPLTASLVELHHGFLTIESELGKGTTATVRLPSSRVLLPASDSPRD